MKRRMEMIIALILAATVLYLAINARRITSYQGDSEQIIRDIGENLESIDDELCGIQYDIYQQQDQQSDLDEKLK